MTIDLGFEPTKADNYYYICFNVKDAERVGAISRRLRNSGVNLWYDRGVQSSEEHDTVIAEKIHNSLGVIVFVTKNALSKQKSSLTDEYRMADFYSKKIYPVFLDNIPNESVPHKLAVWWSKMVEHHTVDASDLIAYSSIANKILNEFDLEKDSSESQTALNNNDSWVWIIMFIFFAIWFVCSISNH